MNATKKDKKSTTGLKSSFVNEYDLHVDQKRESFNTLFKEEKEKKKLNDYGIATQYPFSQFTTNHVKSVMDNKNFTVVSFIKTAFALGYDIELKKI